MTTLPCASCHQLLPTEAFSPDARVPRGRQARCKACRSSEARARRLSQSEVEEPEARDGRACTGCGELRPWDHFHLDASLSDGHRSRCRDCRSEERLVHAPPGPVLPASLLICSGCDQTLPLEDFRADARRRNGHLPLCKICIASARAEARGVERAARASERVEALVDGLQTCEACHQALPLTDFRKHATSVTGYTRICSPCLSARQSERALENADPLDRTIWALRDRAKARDEEIRSTVRAGTEPPPRSPRSG